jgi:predicted O-methyltransferase YrrM
MEFNKLYENFLKKTDIGQTYNECYKLHEITIYTNDIEGSIAEIGAYKGHSAVIISRFKNENKKLYIFDTFEGIVDSCENDITVDDKIVVNNGFACFDNLDYVKNLFEYDKTIFVKKGYFPDCIKEDADFLNDKFSFVHLDVDTYTSTLNCLEFFYEKFSSGGVILTHDYTNVNAPGVKKAFDEFFENKEEKIIVLEDSQAMIIKI